MLFYIVLRDGGKLDISPFPNMDKPGEVLEFLTPGLKFGICQDVLKQFYFSGRFNIPGQASPSYQAGSPRGRLFFPSLIELLRKFRKTKDSRKNGDKEDIEDIKREVIMFLKTQPGLEKIDWAWQGLSDKRHMDKGEEANLSVYSRFSALVTGRQLAEGDLAKLAAELGLEQQEVQRFCHKSVQEGRAEWVSSVRREGKIWRCQRCGGNEVEEWPSSFGVIATCRSCVALGAVTSQQVLFRCIDLGSGEYGKINFSPHWKFSEAQLLASREVLAFAQNKEERKGILWAACGAGKTEVCFPALAWALEQGQFVLFAAPRQDVVHDVAPRLKRDFPGLEPLVLTGSTSVRFRNAQLVLATTHQVLRFYQKFDFVFLDEMDAFPYHDNQALQWGIQNALKPQGKVFYLTATPAREALVQAQEGKMRLIRLPARHHRHPLPIPSWEKFSLNIKEHACPPTLKDRLKNLASSGPVLIFVPKVSWVNPLVERLKENFPNWPISGSFGSDPERQSKLASLRDGEYRFFVSTSILERGVTVPKAQVVVLAADHPVFDERALVQMAGRAGRTKECPQGTVMFLSANKSRAIETAIQWILEQNEIARARGLLD